MNSKVLTLTCALLLSVAASAQVSDYSQLRTNSWSVYGLGGVSAVTGDRLMGNVNASSDTYVAPMVGAGVNYNIRPWVRLGLGYETSKYLREQRWDKVQADGLSYRSLEVAHHDVEFDVDFNLAQIFRKKGESGRFNAYLGTGIGGIFAYGADYKISMGQKETVDPDPMNDNYTFQTWLKAGNSRFDYNGLYVPANLSLEYDITPRFTLGVRGSLKYILDDEKDNLPTMIESVGGLLRVNFVGSKRGYRSKAKQIVSLENDLATTVANVDALTARNAKLSDDLASEQKDNESMKNELSAVKASLEDCGADKKTVDALREEIRDLKAEQFVVYFDNASDKITRKGWATIVEAADKLKADEDATMVITASCSTPGGDEYNKDLSDRRAAAVRQALKENGVCESRITDVISLGKEGMTSAASCRRAIIDVR